MKAIRAFGWVVVFGLIVAGVGINYGPDLRMLPGISWFFDNGVPTRAVIVYETGVDKPLSPALVELYAKAPSLGVEVWDKDVLGKGRKPSPEAQPFLDAAGTEGLPKLVLQWPGGGLTVRPCPTIFDELRKVVGK